MKLAVFVAILAVCQVATPVFLSDNDAHQCMSDNNLTKDEISAMDKPTLQGLINPRAEVKNAVCCILKKMGLLTKDGNIDRDAITRNTTSEQVKQVDACIARFKDLPEPTDKVYKAMDCIMTEYHKTGPLAS